MTQRSDQDSPWKLMLRQYFREAIEFFFPDIARLIDWKKPPEFLDKEFQQIAPEAEIGKRYADQLVKVWKRRGGELFLLLHLEVQGTPETIFAERMFVYSLRIFNYFHQPACSLAILCDRKTNWRPSSYRFELPRTRLQFEFGTVKLLDYRDRWTELEQSQNPFAIVVMAHLKTQETKRNSSDRKEWKMRLVRLLYEKGYDRSEIVNLFRFIDWVMLLSESLKQDFWTELKAYEEQRQMPFITTGEQIGFDRGQKEGRKEGVRSLILSQLNQKVGELPEPIVKRVSALSMKKIEKLAIALLSFETIADLEAWLKANR